MATKQTATNNHRAHYVAVWPNWVTKTMGAQPTNDQLAIVHALGLRPGKQAMVCAAALRDTGVTSHQMLMISAAFDGNPTPQRNRLMGLISTGEFKREAAAGAYKVTLTPKGKQYVDKGATRTLYATPSLKAANGGSVSPDKPAKASKAAKPAGDKPAKAAKPKAPRKPKAPKPAPSDVQPEAPAITASEPTADTATAS